MGLAAVANVLTELVNALTELVNVLAELVNVRALPVSCLMAMLGGISTLMPLIMNSKCELCNANSETMKSNYYFSNSCFAFTLYWASGELQMVGGQQDEAACSASLVGAAMWLPVCRRSVACPFISPCLSCG